MNDQVMTFLVLILLLLITLIVVVLIWLNKYNRATEEIIIRRLKLLSEKTDDNLTTIEEYIHDFMGKTNLALKAEIKKLSNTATSNIKDNNKAFENFIAEVKKSRKKEYEQFSTMTKNLETDYKKYAKEVDRINSNLKLTIEKFDDNNKQLKTITPKVEKNNKELEKVVDKTKELVATHEKDLSDLTGMFGDTMTDVSTKYHDTITDISSTTESVLSKTFEESNSNIQQLFDQIKKEYTELANNSVKELESLSTQLKLTINNEVEKTDLKKMEKTIDDFTQQLWQATASNKLNVTDIKKHFDEKVLEIDEKIETGLKKRRLF